MSVGPVKERILKRPVPCPFCGGGHITVRGGIVTCQDCGASGPDAKNDREAGAKWILRDLGLIEASISLRNAADHHQQTLIIGRDDEIGQCLLDAIDRFDLTLDKLGLDPTGRRLP